MRHARGRRASASRIRGCLVAVLGALGASVFGVAPASAAGPAWRPVALADTTIAPGGAAGAVIQLRNVGDAPLDAASGEMRLTVTLPAGLSATSAGLLSSTALPEAAGWTCFGNVF